MEGGGNDGSRKDPDNDFMNFSMKFIHMVMHIIINIVELKLLVLQI